MKEAMINVTEENKERGEIKVVQELNVSEEEDVEQKKGKDKDNERGTNYGK